LTIFCGGSKFFTYSLITYHFFLYLWLSPKLLCLGNENKIRLLFCISLDFS